MSNANVLHLRRIGQIAIPVQDLSRAVGFYRDVLQLPFLFQTPNLAFLMCGEVRLMLSLPEGGEADHHSSFIYFLVDDLPGAFQTFTSRGVAFIDQPHLVARMPGHELWMAFFRDSEGNTLALMSEVR